LSYWSRFVAKALGSLRSSPDPGRSPSAALKLRTTPQSKGETLLLANRLVVANIGSPDPEDDVFCDIGGVVADALEIARDDKGVEGLRGKLGLVLNERAEGVEGSIIHLVYLIIERKHGLRQFGIRLDEGLERFADHGRGQGG
jgi:hypothetical protein